MLNGLVNKIEFDERINENERMKERKKGKKESECVRGDDVGSIGDSKRGWERR